MADDILTALRSLANRWTMLARDYARVSKDSGTNEVVAQYNRGYAEGYYKAATELAALIKEQENRSQPPPQGGRRTTGRLTTPPPQHTAQRPAQSAASSVPAAPAASAVKYAAISVGEALSILAYAGVTPRDINQNKDNSFRGVFSRWENMMPHERLALIQKADPRIIILSNGKTETQDHFVDFAFKET